MRLPEDTGESTFRVGNDSPTIPQETSRNIPIGVEHAGGKTATSSRTDPFLQSYDIEENNWRSLVDNTQPRSLARGISLGRDSNNNTYSADGTSTGAETGLSPNTGTRNTSNHPTPNSTAPSDTRSSNIQHGQNSANNGSYETSPASNTNTSREPHRVIDEFFATRSDYGSIPAATSMSTDAFRLPDTPGRSFAAAGSWGNAGNTGLMPVGEGVFRHMMELGPMDAMDIWEGGS